MVKRGARAGELVGLSVSQHNVCAVIARSEREQRRIWRAELTAFSPEGASEWPSLATALKALARELSAPGAKIAIALQSPLVELRMAELPALRDTDVRQLLEHNAGKYFASARGAQVVSIVPAAKNATTRIVACASARLLDAIHLAAREAGFTVASIVPAESAWAAATTSFSDANGTPARIMIVNDTHTMLLTGAHAQLTDIRRFRAGISDIEDIIAACSGVGTNTVLVGHPALRDVLSHALTARGLRLHNVASIDAELRDAPDALAARFATVAGAPALVTHSEMRDRSAQARRLSIRLGAAAALLVLLAASLQLWGVRRELEAVRAEREALRPQLSATLVGRTTVETAFRQLALLAASEHSAPLWSRVIGGISDQLPYEAYLTGFRGRADTVGVDGLAQQAARVFDALENVPQLRSVHASSPVRRETTADGVALERFQLSALLQPTVPDSAGTQP